ncbi:hypothetical protein R1flu_002849 [Riccia fluitans]|uniref:Uncharacterized protein n=1 Tax=Riccia fluitans TaxID=41844 RepID=A0ABD1Y892_9MARC
MLITSLDDLRQRCKLPEEIPIASPECKRGLETDQPGSTKKPRVEDNERELPSTKKVINSRLLPFVEVAFQRHFATIDTWKKAYEDQLSKKLAQVQTELDEYKRSSEASIKKLDEEDSHLREALVAKESAVQALVDAHKKEISTLKATCRKYEMTLDGEIGTNADFHARVQNLEDELNASKYTWEQAL